MKKHAYLITAYNNFVILEKLLKALDDPRNDIYLHIDKKSSHVDIDRLNSTVSEATLHIINRMNVTWGAYSMIQCELRLLEAAHQHRYGYYHMISGTDFPIKSQNYIHEYLDKHNGKEFVHFSGADYTQTVQNRFKLYHLLHEYCGKNRRNPLLQIEKILLLMQKIMGVDRTKKSGLIFCAGSTWYSISDSLVSYILSQRELIKKIFSHSFVCDEIFLQTIVYNSPFKANVFMLESIKDDSKACLRLIDWKRGSPYEFRIDDAQELIGAGSDYLFARKFSDNQSALVDIISKSYSGKGSGK